jgi:hypothetical protein
MHGWKVRGRLQLVAILREHCVLQDHVKCSGEGQHLGTSISEYVGMVYLEALRDVQKCGIF